MNRKRKLALFLSFVLLISFIGCYKPYDIVADTTPPGEVTKLIVDKQDVDVHLNWNPPSDHDLVGFYVSLYSADNQRLVTSENRPPDSANCVFEKLAAGNYYAKVQTRDKENNLSDGVAADFVFLSKAPVNVRGISVQINWNVMHVSWDSLTAKDYTTEVEGQKIVIPVDSIIINVDSGYRRIALLPTATSAVIPDLPDGYHSVSVSTYGETGYYSSEYRQALLKVQFADKFVRVQGDGHDFYMAKYEVTATEFQQFVSGIGTTRIYKVDNNKIENDQWFKWWYGTDPGYRGSIYLVGFDTYEFTLNGQWLSNRYPPASSFGRETWEGAMLYCLANYNGRCPTKEEWLYAAKGGALSKGYDYAGSNDPDAVGWWGATTDPNVFLQPPGLKMPNELGIYDMSGNAAEILYDLAPASSGLGITQVIGGSYGPIHFWGNEVEDYGPDNSIKTKLSDPDIVKNTNTLQNDGQWRMGIRVLIPHEEIIKPPVNIHKYEQ